MWLPVATIAAKSSNKKHFDISDVDISLEGSTLHLKNQSDYKVIRVLVEYREGSAQTKRILKPGQSIDKEEALIDESYQPISSIEDTEPVQIQILYVKEKKVYSYVYKNSSQESHVELAEGTTQWKSKDVPQPKSEFFQCTTQYGAFWFFSYGVSKKEFKAYMKQLEKEGYTVVVTETNFTAKKEEKLISGYYDTQDKSLEGLFERLQEIE